LLKICKNTVASLNKKQHPLLLNNQVNNKESTRIRVIPFNKANRPIDWKTTAILPF
jgi:hypothetical protein